MKSLFDSTGGRRRLLGSILGAILLPVFVVSASMLLEPVVSRYHFHVFYKPAIFIVSTAIGCAALAFIPVTVRLRFLLLAVYAPLIYFGVLFYSFFFCWLCFGDCL
jgi:hypothetical protein